MLIQQPVLSLALFKVCRRVDEQHVVRLFASLQNQNANGDAGRVEDQIEDVNLSNCYFGHEGLPTQMRVSFGTPFAPMPEWQNIKVPEKEDAYQELLHFGPTPCHGFFIHHLHNLEISHVEIAPAALDLRPAFWLEGIHRADFSAITAPRQKNFALRNVSDFCLIRSRAAKDMEIQEVTNTII